METGSRVTQVFLEREVEDVDLYNEIHKVIADLKIGSSKAFIKRYPMLNELKHYLYTEIYKD